MKAKASVIVSIVFACCLLWQKRDNDSLFPPSSQVLAINGQTMGTTYMVKIAEDLPAAVDLKHIKHKIAELLETVNQQMSTYIVDSELSQFNREEANKWFPVSLATAFVIDSALKISRDSDGAFDVTMGNLVNLWGFGPLAERQEPPEDQEIKSLLSQLGSTHLHSRLNPAAVMKSSNKLYVDLSGIAKGYGVDVLYDYLSSLGLSHFMVEIGGEIRASGQKFLRNWEIAIEEPVVGSGRGGVHQVLQLGTNAIATSGDYRNYFEDGDKQYSHLLDPRTGYPISHKLASVTVIAATTMEADAWATAFFVMGPDKIKSIAAKKEMAVYMIVKNQSGFSHWHSQEFQQYFKFSRAHSEA